MTRRALVVGVVALACVINAPESSACGDKFLRMGRSGRMRGYAAVHPSSILIYSPLGSTPASIRQFEALLKRAGHTPVSVEHGADLMRVLAEAKFDVVIAAYADATGVETAIRSLTVRPGVLPILDKPTPQVAAEAERQYHCLIKPQTMTKYEAFAEIDHLIERRLRAGTAAATP